MKRYKFNSDTLRLEPDNKPPFLSIILAILTVVFAIWVVSNMRCTRVEAAPSEPIVAVVSESVPEDDHFTFDHFKQYVIDLNLKFPDIVIAQALIESGNFSSRIWEENNNPFGMKQARSRNTTALGTNRGHATFKSWRMAVVDYSYLQAVFARKVKTRAGYYEFLNSYAEDPGYEQKLKRIIRKHKGFGISDDYLSDY